MTTYLLLRNNKQSGPYSLEDLKNMGMKAYDLVWLEGKSAAWRYPSEIDELKEFAPAVEEQPFDRFYKKPGVTANVSNGSGANNDTAGTTTTIAFQPATETSAPGESSVLTRKRIIYVTLPAGKSAPATVRETQREILRETPRDISRETPAREPQRETLPIPVNGDYPSLSDRKIVAPVESTPRRRSHKNERLFQILGVGGSILALLAAGIFIGLSLNKETLGLQKRIASRATPPTIMKQPASTTQTSPVPTLNASVPANTPEKAADMALTTDVASTVTGKSARVRKRDKSKTAPAAMPPVQKDSALADIPILSREAVHRTATEPSPADSKESVRTELASEVSVGTNGYSVGTFGGINDLQLTVTNRSTYPLDLVVVEVQYIQANKKIYKTENLYFRDIGPGAALMQEAPKSSRGIRVQYKITSISSKELGLSYSGL